MSQPFSFLVKLSLYMSYAYLLSVVCRIFMILGSSRRSLSVLCFICASYRQQLVLFRLPPSVLNDVLIARSDLNCARLVYIARCYTQLSLYASRFSLHAAVWFWDGGVDASVYPSSRFRSITLPIKQNRTDDFTSPVCSKLGLQQKHPHTNQQSREKV